MKRNYKLTLEYDGTRYSGWQAQANARTVMGDLIGSAQEFFQAGVEVMGAGRTDAGVHAAAQVAHLRVTPREELPPERILAGLNRRLPGAEMPIDAACASWFEGPTTKESNVYFGCRPAEAADSRDRCSEGGSGREDARDGD